MNQKKYLLFKGYAYAISIIVILVFVTYSYLQFNEIDEFGIIFGVIFISLLSYKSYSCFKEIKNTREEEMPFAPPTDASKSEIISYYKKIFYISIPAFVILSIWIYIDLRDLETGKEDYVRIWAPISFLYEIGGFRFAVLATPFLGILCWFAFWRIIKKTKESE